MDIGAQITQPAAGRLRVWFDGDCPICATEVAALRRLDGARRVDFINLASTPMDPLERAIRLSRLHAQTSDGAVVSGADAVLTIWGSIPILRPLALLLRHAVPLKVLEHAYRVFLKVRPQVRAMMLWRASWALRRP